LKALRGAEGAALPRDLDALVTLGNKKRDPGGAAFVISILSSVYHTAMGDCVRFSGNISGVESGA